MNPDDKLFFEVVLMITGINAVYGSIHCLYYSMFKSCFELDLNLLFLRLKFNYLFRYK